MADKQVVSSERKHHEKSKVCFTRPSYREARWERAVKVYTINQESKYIIVSGVAAVGVDQELIDKFSSYGNILEYRKLNDYPTEEFTEVYLIKYERINNARFAKRKMDNKSFFGGILHVFYAPEYESVEDCRFKLEERRKAIARKTQGTFKQDATSITYPATTRIPTATLPTTTLPTTTTILPTTTSDATTDTTVKDTSSTTGSGYNQGNNQAYYQGNNQGNNQAYYQGNNQGNYSWNLPPLPPPPFEVHPMSRGISAGQVSASNNTYPAPRGFAEYPTHRGIAAGRLSSGDSYPAPRGIALYPASRGIDLYPASRGITAGRISSCDSYPASRGIAAGQFPIQPGQQSFSQNNILHGQQATFPPRFNHPSHQQTHKRPSEADSSSSSHQPQGQKYLNKKQRKRI